MKEIELLFELKCSFEQAQDAVKQFNFVGYKKTVDRYYYDPLRKNLQLTDGKLLECLRLRKKNDEFTLTHKFDYYKGHEWLYSDEDEISVSDFNTALKILSSLGLELLVEVISTKHIYKAEDYELVLEQVDGLGNFFEIEYRKDNNLSVDMVKNNMREFVSTLGLLVGSELNSGKPELLINKNRK